MHEKIKRRRLSVFLLLIMMCLPIFAYADNTPLTAEKAFNFSVSVQNTSQINAQWEIAKGYYLYRAHLHFASEPNVIAEIRLPQGIKKQDPDRGEYEVYSDQLNIPLLLNQEVKKLDLTIEYRGCAEDGFCYPPVHKTLTVNLEGAPQAEISNSRGESLQSLLTNQNSVNALLNSQSLVMLLLIFAGIGFLLAFTPCVLPMIPILTSIIAGHKENMSAKKAFCLSSTYVLGSSITYAAAGLFAAYLGGSLQVWLQKPWIIATTSALFVFLSFSLFGLYDLRLPSYWQNRLTAISRKQEGGNYTGVFIMGVISTLIVSPCVTAPLIGVLMYIAQTGNLLLGASALFVMSIGMGIPLIVIGVSAGKWLPKRGPWMKGVQYILGLLMFGMALWLLSKVFSFVTVTVFAAILLLGLALFFGIYRSRYADPLFYRSLGVIVGLGSLSLIIAVNSPSVSHYFLNNYTGKSTVKAFTIVHNLNDLQSELTLAEKSGKPVILDFYADWCESCIVMDKKVFSNPNIINRLNRFVLLRADLSKNNEADEAILKNYGVIAPPTVLFFNIHGQEVNAHRIVGELNAEEFMNRINLFITRICDKNATC